MFCVLVGENEDNQQMTFFIFETFLGRRCLLFILKRLNWLLSALSEVFFKIILVTFRKLPIMRPRCHGKPR